MKVSELIEHLQKQEQELEVWYECGDRLTDEVLSRPDPLALLEAWILWKSQVYLKTSIMPDFIDFKKICGRIRTNPSVVLKELKEKGVWK
jgi:hypothetical protein